MEPGKISKYRALVDTSSVVAHDLCAQLHVLQFCVDEMADHIKPEGQVYLERMGASTSYLSRLVDTFRKQLKLSMNDNEPHALSDIHQGAMELVKNHFFVVLERVDFSENIELTRYKIKNDGRKLMHIIFALYSLFIDEVKESNFLDDHKLSFLFEAKPENDRFVMLHLSLKGKQYTKAWFDQQCDSVVAEKGKLRQFLGLNFLKEKRAEDPNFIRFEELDNGCSLHFLVPLAHEE